MAGPGRSLSRRSLLLASPAAALSLLGCARPSGGPTEAVATSAPGAPSPAAPPASAPTADSLEALALRLRATPRPDVLAMAAAAAQRGASFETLLGAVFLAGVADIRPRGVGGKLHSVMMIESMFQLGESLSPADKLRLALWSADDFKASQARDRDDGDWVLPPRPSVSFADAAAAKRELDAAMAVWDDERADRAITGLVERAPHGAVFEAIWPWAARSFIDIGHKIIHAAQLERTLRRIGWQHAEPVLRTIVQALLYRYGGDGETASHETAQARLAALPQGYLTGKEEPERSASLLPALRASDAAKAQDTVIAAFKDGLGPATIWDALRLHAADTFLQRKTSRPATEPSSLVPVHAVTVTEAFAHAFASATSDTTKRLVLLQAAGWLATLRARFASRGWAAADKPALDTLVAREEATSVDELLAEPVPERALGLFGKSPRLIADYRSALAAQLARKGEEHHQHKYAAAMLGEAERSHPRWRHYLLSAALPYLPVPADPATETGKRIDLALKSEGLIPE